MNTTVVFVIASTGYHPVEYGIPKKIIEQAGYMVTTASDQSGIATSAPKQGTADITTITTADIDIPIEAINIDRYDAVVFIGGPGALSCLDNQQSYALLKKAYNARKIIGAICIAPRILAKAGILRGKRATGWDEDGALREIFLSHDVTYEPRPLVVDGTIVTATGPQVAYEFGAKIVEQLSR